MIDNPHELLKDLADLFDVSLDCLIGRKRLLKYMKKSQNNYYELFKNALDERGITINDLENEKVL